jgi:translation initiation factor IF-3
MRRKFRFAKRNKADFGKDFKANERIESEEVFLIDENSEKIGAIPTREALARAREASLDLVEVNPKANPPIAKILDLGQFKYEQNKKINKQKALQKKVEIKNIRLSLRISKHDFDFRVEQAFKFLKKSNKLKVEMILKGREKQHFPKAKEVMNNFVNDLKGRPEISVEEEQPLTKQPGGFSMILVNKK